MSRATPDDQLKFLLNCVKHSNNGKIDFVEVAKECGIVSKGAAAKRYERLMKANGINPNGGPSDKCLAPPAPKEKSKAAIARSAAAKKRKIEGDRKDSIKNDDEDDFPLLPKPEPAEQHQFKQELPAPTQMLSPMPMQMPLAMPHRQVQYPPIQHFPVQHFPVQHSAIPGPNYVLSRPGPRPICHSVPPPPPPPQYVLNYEPSIFDEFCTPELFSHNSFDETRQSPEQPRTIPLPPQELVPISKPVEKVVGTEHGRILDDVILIPD